MCPDKLMYPHSKSQAGFLMPLALFIVVGLGALALAISRMGSGSFSSVVQEALAVQAFYAAESGAHYGLNQLLFDAEDKNAVDARCASVDGATVNFTVAGLRECSATLECSTQNNTGENAGIYRLRSFATCGSGSLQAQRSVVTAARYE
jgi:MSHA biogenesis protein MshP